MGEDRDAGRPEELRSQDRAVGLPEELRALGRAMGRPGDDGETVVEQVLRRILDEQVPVPVAEPRGPAEWLRSARRRAGVRWQAMAAGLCGLAAVLVLTPPVRASVADWFGFGGVEVRVGPSAAPPAVPSAAPPAVPSAVPTVVPSARDAASGCGGSVTLGEAGRRAGFRPVVPRAFGEPDAVTVVPLPGDRSLVGLCRRERGRTVRIDEFRAGLDFAFVKTVDEHPEFLALGAGGDGSGTDPVMPEQALWFPKPHLLTFWLVGADGERFTRSERTAGPTLLWTHRGLDGVELTFRLEGVDSKERALEIARSAP
ncbi:hypothetical protein ABZ330_26290 [Streptomyces sp. NPDC006172]|uniref:hypothetical protein n=1 Tax=Streptomyces sp. NPDC006172 TaxID=3154470 RepID=UPI0033C0FC4A